MLVWQLDGFMKYSSFSSHSSALPPIPDAAADRKEEFEKDIEYKSDAEMAMAQGAEAFVPPPLAEPAPTNPVPDPQPTCPPDMPPPDPVSAPTPSLFISPYLADELYNGDFSDSALTTLYTIDSSYYSDGDLTTTTITTTTTTTMCLTTMTTVPHQRAASLQLISRLRPRHPLPVLRRYRR